MIAPNRPQVRGLTTAEGKPKNLVLKARDPGIERQKMKNLDERLVTGTAPTAPNYQFIIPPWTYQPPRQGMPSFQPNGNFPVPMATVPASVPQSALNPELLGITKWLQALDADKKHHLDGVCFFWGSAKRERVLQDHPTFTKVCQIEASGAMVRNQGRHCCTDFPVCRGRY